MDEQQLQPQDILKIMDEVCKENALAFEILCTPDRIQKYLDGACSLDEEQEILDLRCAVPWFDCAIFLLTDVSSAVADFDNKIQQDAQYFLASVEQIRCYNNPFILAFLSGYPDGSALMEFQAAAGSYTSGDIYQILKFPSPEQEKYTLTIHFYWIENDEYIADRYWGRLKLTKQYTEEGHQKFFTQITVSLIFNKEQKQIFQCDCNGEFDIPKTTWQQMKKYLNNSTLECILQIKKVRSNNVRPGVIQKNS